MRGWPPLIRPLQTRLLRRAQGVSPCLDHRRLRMRRIRLLLLAARPRRPRHRRDCQTPAARQPPAGVGGESGPRPSPSAPAIPAAAAGDLKTPTTPAARLSDDSSPLGSSQHLSVVAGSSLCCNGATYRGPSLTLPRRSPWQHVSTTAADDMDPICLFAADNSIQRRRPI